MNSPDVAPERAKALTVGIDLGGTGTRLVAIDYAGTVEARHSVATRHRPVTDINSLIADLTAQIQDIAETGVLDAVGIGASGPVDAHGSIRNDDTLPAYSHLPLTELIRAELSVPCAIDNDAVTAAIGENTYGAGQHSPMLLAITLGTGVGVALLTNNTPYRGSDGVNPEAGHIPIPGPPAPCYCGLRTCWEQLASRTALDIATGNATVERAAMAAAGDQPSCDIFTQYGQYVGVGLSILATAFRPARVVICGSVARYLPLFRAGISRTMTQSRPYSWTPPIAAAELGEYSGAIGAAVLARTARRD
jgi:glucokinase